MTFPLHSRRQLLKPHFIIGIFALLIVSSACVTPHSTESLNRAISKADIQKISPEKLEQHAERLEKHYQSYNQVEGIAWQSTRSDSRLAQPDRYGSGGDSCLFTGYKLASDAFRYKSTQRPEHLAYLLQSLRGTYILTHVTGTPGALARCAFPSDKANLWGYPATWSRRDPRFVHTKNLPMAAPANPQPAVLRMTYYTRATRDQLSGLIFGLAVAWHCLSKDEAGLTRGPPNPREDQARVLIATVTQAVFDHLQNHDFRIRDENGLNDTYADKVSGLLLVQLLALYKETVQLSQPERRKEIQELYESNFDDGFFNAADYFHRFTNYQQYYAWNLRYLRGFSIFILEDNDDRKTRIRDWFEFRLWAFTSGHLNSQFTFIYKVIHPKIEKSKMADGVFALKSLSLKSIRASPSPLSGDERKPGLFQVLLGDWDRFVIPPHLRKPTTYSTWQKEPWDTGKKNNGQSFDDATGLDFLLSYWLGRCYGFISKK
ncbi:MAG: hypothetical protein P1V97_03300 [Planctomycetota bacterium]|nr:hypothetical protein [Planctomycetota bacterium]